MSKLWGQSIMQFLNLISFTPVLFGLKVLIQLKNFIFYTKNPSEPCSFKMNSKFQNSHTRPLFKESKVPKSVDKTALENCIFYKKSLRFTTICFQYHLFQILV